MMKNYNYLQKKFSEKYLDLRRMKYVASVGYYITKNITIYTIYIYNFVLIG
jgi:hypothetical protein